MMEIKGKDGLNPNSHINEILNRGDRALKSNKLWERVDYLLSLRISESIFNTLGQIPVIMENDSDSKAGRIVECRGIYRDMDKSLSQWKYNKQTHVDVLSEYKDFLSKNGLEDSAGEIQTRIDIMQKEIDEKSKKISELWSKISKLLKSLISTITPLMIHEIKISFIEINKLAYEIGYDKVEHELILQEYRKFLKNIGLKREADVIGKDIEILRTGYDKNVFMATLSEYRDSFLELGFKDDAKSMQEIIDVMSK